MLIIRILFLFILICTSCNSSPEYGEESFLINQICEHEKDGKLISLIIQNDGVFLGTFDEKLLCIIQESFRIKQNRTWCPDKECEFRYPENINMGKKTFTGKCYPERYREIMLGFKYGKKKKENYRLNFLYCEKSIHNMEEFKNELSRVTKKSIEIKNRQEKNLIIDSLQKLNNVLFVDPSLQYNEKKHNYMDKMLPKNISYYEISDNN